MSENSFGAFRLKDEESNRNVRKAKRKQPSQYRSADELRQDLLELVRRNEGKPLSLMDMSKMLGYQSPNSTTPALKKLIREGVVRQFGLVRGRKRYYLSGSDAHKKRVSDNRASFDESKSSEPEEPKDTAPSGGEEVSTESPLKKGDVSSLLEFLENHTADTPVSKYLRWLLTN